MRPFVHYARHLTSILPLLLVSACGQEDPGTDGSGGVDGPLLPFSSGNSWSYQVTASGVVTTKVTTIGAEEEVGGTGPNGTVRAFKVETKKGTDGSDQTISWQGPLDGRIVRYREQSFSASTGQLELEEHWDPWKLHVDETDEHLVQGAQWLEIYDETKISIANGTPGAPSTAEARDLWRVVATSEKVTVPKGTFDAIVFEKTGGTTKRYWYVPGVGKVKETGAQTEELVDYEVSP